MKVLVVYYSTYGHVYRMAEAVAEGARSVEGAKVELRRVPETLPREVLEKMGALEAQKSSPMSRFVPWTNSALLMPSSLGLLHDSAICAARCASSLMLRDSSG